MSDHQTLLSVMSDSFFLDISIGGIEGHPYEVGSKISEKDVIEGGVEAHGLELDIVVDFVGYFEVVHLQAKLLPLKYAQTV